EQTEQDSSQPPPLKTGPIKLKPSAKKKEPRKFFSDNSPRSDAGIFHVAFALGGNFYIEPKLNASTKAFADDYFRDFGYQGGVYFDYDYSRMAENIPLSLRGYIGYKYAMNSTHIFAVEGVVRRMFQVSETSDFGIGAGVSLATWFRSTSQVENNQTTQIDETILLPTFIVSGGFDFNPFMVDLKWMIHRMGEGNTIMGAEFNFGVRL
ncbi:MAG: hypothetical protein EB078_11220, partial [Proteobacteria bacterium]|nr:hypothetical protein [Pseudomonadota bacterium]NDD05468.1 hypothetical protein [Pseudomonadota bacterium]